MGSIYSSMCGLGSQGLSMSMYYGMLLSDSDKQLLRDVS